MARLIAALLAVHGLIHLMGTTAYLRLANVQGLPYKTTVLNGRLDLGATGIGIFGVLWLVPAAGFLAAAAGLLVGWSWWRTALGLSASLSLLLCGLDWNVAFMGVLIDVAILAVLAVRGT